MEKERWDLFDRQRRPLGRTFPRGPSLPQGTYHLVVEVWTVDGHGHVLLTRRSPQKESWPGYWECTAGSALAGEESLTAILRELREETGIIARPEELTLMGTQWGAQAAFDTYLLVRDIPRSHLVLQREETCEARWVTLAEFGALLEAREIAEPMARRLQAYRQQLEAAARGRKPRQG